MTTLTEDEVRQLLRETRVDEELAADPTPEETKQEMIHKLTTFTWCSRFENPFYDKKQNEECAYQHQVLARLVDHITNGTRISYAPRCENEHMIDTAFENALVNLYTLYANRGVQTGKELSDDERTKLVHALKNVRYQKSFSNPFYDKKDVQKKDLVRQVKARLYTYLKYGVIW